MQDIAYRKVTRRGNSPLKPVPQRIPSAPRNERLASVIERAIFYAGKTGDWLIGALNARPNMETEKPSRLALKPAKRPLGSRITERSRATAAQAGRAAHATVKATGKAAKTPLGKVTIAQTAALLALFAYVTHATPTQVTPPQQADAAVRDTAQAAVQTLHQFLPTAQDYVKPRPFQESSVGETTSLALNAWAAPWNLDSVATSAQSLTSISAFWLTLQPDGMTFQPKADWSQWRDFVAKNRQPGQKLYLTATGDPADVLLGIGNPESRSHQIAAMLALVNEQSFDGIDVDYEGLDATDKDVFTEFVSDLAAAFHAKGKLVSVTVEARMASQVPMDWSAIGTLADQVRVMAYDYHASTTDQPGPIAPLGWVKEVVQYAESTIPPKKIVIGLGNYGYDWQQPDKEGDSWKATAVSFSEATALAQAKNVSVTRASGIDARGYDIGSIPNFVYKDDSGREHDVWFEDAASLQAKTALVNQYVTAGVIFWSVGLGDSQFWNPPTASTGTN